MMIHQYLENATSGKSAMSQENIDKVATDIKDALNRQFNTKRDDKFRLRMSNIGRPSCQLWFEKNKPETALPKPTTFVMNMMIGDIVEAVFKAILRESNVKFEDTENVTLELDEDTKISGSYDLVMNDAVDDIKSASDWSYKYKFDSYESLHSGDSFGYVGQLAGYAKASNKKAGGWWVVNKANGHFKYVRANIDMDKELDKIKVNIKKTESDELVRCFEPEPETFRGKPTGNMVLNKNCTFCSYRQSCWETLRELPAQMSQAKEPKMVQYVKLKGE
jgi:CRISPR/Cas system-associated exonuclease Cas4 (RecB family)